MVYTKTIKGRVKKHHNEGRRRENAETRECNATALKWPFVGSKPATLLVGNAIVSG